MRAQGKIATWNDEKGFGFIAPASGGNQVFVHIKAFPRGIGRPSVGAEVTYEFASDAQARPRAENVKVVGHTSPLSVASKAFIIAAVFISAVAVVTIVGLLPSLILWLYLGMSILTLGIYALDKSAARKNAQRIPENWLHMLALLGGWPGALYAQQLLRHKSSKTRFRIIFWFTLVINVFGFFYLLSPYGSWLTGSLKKLVG
jgi:uncharacterized membrane protein YsdA (DUF1294 family)/cold shock CspA family protein